MAADGSNIRRAAPEDVREVRDIRLRMLTESPTAFDASLEDAQQLDEAGWLTWIGVGASGEQRCVWISRAITKAVGMIAAGVVDDECRIGALWVDPSVRGEGVGAALLDAAETWCHDVQARWNVLSVSEANEDAQRLYLSRGYSFTGASKPTRWGVRELVMRKPVGR